jgi:hypothetical protein
MRRVVLACLLAGCVTQLGPGPRATDASSTDATLDTASTNDAGAAIDAFAPRDAAIVDAPTCTPTRTSCNMNLECGAIPNGCPGGSYDCGTCSGGETWCATLAMPRWRSRVASCVSSVAAAHPEFFDTMSCSTGMQHVIATMTGAWVSAVASCVNGNGALAIVDGNAPDNEIRVRGTDDDVADNYSVRLYGSGCTSSRYTSSCTPSFF